MKKCCFLVVIFSFFNQILLAENFHNNSFEYSEQPFDVISYKLLLDISQTNQILQKNLKGINRIEIFWKDKDSNNKFFFHLKGLIVDSVFKNEQKIEFYDNITDEPLEQYYYIIKNDTAEKSNLTIYYSGQMISEGGSMNWGGVHYRSNILFNMGVSFNDPVVSAARYWMPCFDHPQDKALFEAEFITPIDQVVASNGLLIHEKIENNKKYTIWKQDIPSATYLMNFAISNFAKIDLKNNEVPAVIYSLKTDSLYSHWAYSNVEKMNKCYSDIYTPYPFEKIGYVNTPIGSMEHQTMISLARTEVLNAAAQKDSNNTTIAHELSHSWFGNMVSPKDFRDAWFNESFATHAEAVWANCVAVNTPWVKTSYNQVIGEYWNTYINNIVKSEGILPLYNFKKYQKNGDNVSYKNNVVNYPTTIYYKGAAVVNHLRNLIGHQKFDDIIKHILTKYKNSNISTQDLLDEFNAQSDLDLTDFFKEWIYQPGFPILDIQYSTNNHKFELNVEQIQDEQIYGKYTSIKLPVLIKTSTNEYIKYFYFTGKKWSLVDSIPDNETILKIEINNDKYEISPIKYQLNLVSVDDYEIENYFKIFDNNDEFIIDFNISNIILKYEIVNLLGNINNVSLENINNQIIIDKTSMTSGIYFLKAFTSKNKLIVIKIII